MVPGQTLPPQWEKRADDIQPGEVGTTVITDSAITANKILAGAVTATKVAADAIDGKTITGATIRTAATNPKVQMDTTGIKSIDSGGTTELSIVSGSTTGAIDITAASNGKWDDSPVYRALRFVTATEVAAAYEGSVYINETINDHHARMKVLDRLGATKAEISMTASNYLDASFTASDISVDVNGHQKVLLWSDGNSDWQFTVSDRRLKKNIKKLSNPMDTLRQLRGVNFDWKKGKGPEGRRAGVIAQEVTEHFPEATAGSPDAHGVDSLAMLGLLVEAVKSIDTRLDALESAT
jgi:hypothetical protein